MEVLFRRLLQYRNRPALLYFHMWMPGFDQDNYWNSTIEDETDILVKYYQLQSLSFRNAIYKPYVTQLPGFRDIDISCSYVHPTYLGHRCGRAFMLPQRNVLGWGIVHELRYLHSSARVPGSNATYL